MLNKSTIILELQRARLAHERWIKKVEHFIEGLPVDVDTITLVPTDCGFGKWFYGPIGENLKNEYVFERTMERIEHCHNTLHETYEKVYILFHTKPSSLIARIIPIGGAKRQRAMATLYLEKLKILSEELLYLIGKLEKAVKAVDTVLLSKQKYKEGNYKFSA